MVHLRSLNWQHDYQPFRCRPICWLHRPSQCAKQHNHEKNGFHLEIIIDANGTIGSGDAAHINDVMVESALTSIIDLEDLIAAVDAEDKVLAYRNWHQIMCGTLTAEFNKNGKIMSRALNADKCYVAADGSESILRGRALMLVRNVGHLMTNPAILLSDGSEIPEGILDAFVSVAAALPDMSSKLNSPAGSIYVVKPKMHGPEEVAFAVETFDMVEQLLNLPTNTIKIGINGRRAAHNSQSKRMYSEQPNRALLLSIQVFLTELVMKFAHQCMPAP